MAARSTIPWLEKSGITEFKVCISEDHWVPNQVLLDKYPIHNLNEVLKESDCKWDVFVSYVNDCTDLTVELPKRFPNRINKVFQFDVFPHFWQGPGISYVNRDYYEQHAEELDALYNELADELSRNSMISFIEQRISGNYVYSKGVLSDPQNEYFDPEIIPICGRKTLIDCGAYDGRETKEFIERFEDGSFSFVLEPDLESVNIIKENLKCYSDRIDIKSVALSEADGEVPFVSGGELGSGIGKSGNTIIESLSLDTLYVQNGDKFENEVIIKMDIEGSELSALKGGFSLIKEKKPKLAICIYHLKEDLITIPNYIKSINPEYKLYLRRYYRGYRDTVLHAI